MGHLSLRQLYELGEDLCGEFSRRNRVATLPCIPRGREVNCLNRDRAIEELSVLLVPDINELANWVCGELVRRYPQNGDQVRNVMARFFPYTV